MTKTITFNFTNPSHAIPQTTGVSLNGREIKSPEAQRTLAEMNSLMGRLFSGLKETADKQREYELLRNCSEFTASIDLPPGEEKLTLKIKIVTEEKIWVIEQPLRHQTSAPLNLRSLVPLHSSPPRLSPILTQVLSTPTPTAVIHADTPKYKRTEAKKSEKKPSTPPPPKGWLSRLIDWILSFFPFSTTPPAITEKSPLIYHTSSASTPTQVVAGIRGLRNGNNICFINAIFQALMNIPEMKRALIAAHENKIVRDRRSLEELASKIAEAETQLGTIQLELQEVTKDYAWYHYLLPDAKYTEVYGRLQTQYKTLLDRQYDQNKVQASLQASRTFIDAISNYGEKSTYLNDLRGFIEGSLGGWKQEDAAELLTRIFEPLIYLFEHPTETTPAVLDSLKRTVSEFGEEKRMEPYIPKAEESEARAAAFAKENDPIQLSITRILGRLENSLIVPLHIPSQKIHLQALLQSQFIMSKTAEQDDPCICQYKGGKAWFQMSEKRLALGTPNKVAPEFLTLQLKRFRSYRDGTSDKIHTEIELPEDNKVTLVVNGDNVTYEIQTLVQHSGYTPNGGHYFSYVKKDGSWVEANDETVAKLDKLPSSAPSEVYLIFLKKVQPS